MPKKRTASRHKKKKHMLSKPALVLAVLLIVCAGLAATTIPSVLPSSTVAQRFPGDPNPLVSGKAFFGASGDYIANHEAAAGKSVSIYRKFNQWNTASSAVSAINTNYSANRLVWISFKTPTWASVANGSQDATLDAMLRTIDGTGHPVWVTFWHEPENDEGQSNAGSAADWLNMQKHIRARMTAVGTKNIAFAPIYQSSKIVSMGSAHDAWYASGVWDFLGFDIYQQNDTLSILNSKWTTTMNWILGKGQPYAIGEWGVRSTAPSSQITDFWNWPFANGKDMVGMSYFDSDANSVGSWLLTGANNNAFNNILASDVRVMRVTELGSSVSTGGGGGGSTTDTTKPTVSITAPSNGATVGGTITVTGNSSDNVGVKAVTLRVDDKWLATDSTAPYSFSLDTTKYSDGTHTITLRAFDAVDNMGEASIAVNVNNATSSGGSSGSGSSGSSSSSGGTTVITPTSDAGTSESDPVPVEDTVVIQPSVPGAEVTVEVDGEPVNGTAIDTTSLTNGTHKVTVTENGQQKDIYISVKNPWPKAMLNEIKANPVAYSAGGVVVLGAFAALWFFRSYVYNYIMRFKDKDLVTFGSGNQLTKRPKKK